MTLQLPFCVCVWPSVYPFCAWSTPATPFVCVCVWPSFYSFCTCGIQSTPFVFVTFLLPLTCVWPSIYLLCMCGLQSTPYLPLMCAWPSIYLLSYVRVALFLCPFCVAGLHSRMKSAIIWTVGMIKQRPLARPQSSVVQFVKYTLVRTATCLSVCLPSIILYSVTNGNVFSLTVCDVKKKAHR